MTTETGLRSAAESVQLDWGAVRTYLAAHGHRLETDPPPSADSGKMPGLCHQPGIQGWQQGQAACMYRTAE